MKHYRAIRLAITWWLQRRWRGWDDRDVWALDTAIAKFILPRLRYFRKHHAIYPPDMTVEEWRNTLDTIINAMEITLSEDRGCQLPDTDLMWVNEGFTLLGKYLMVNGHTTRSV